MNDRPNDIKRIRPEIGSTQSFGQMGLEEKFQNNTLRPILKLQNPLLIAVFHNYIVKHKGVFFDLSIEKRLAYIENALYKDQKFRNALKGMIIGHFTVDEYKDYIAYSSSLNKRMMNMAVERLKNQVEYFQPLEEKKAL
jgi:hypothetical protein